MDLNGCIAIVTGGSRGIGRQLALDLAGHGAHVVLAARDQAHLDDAVEAVRRSGGSANGVRCDVADPSQVQHLIDGVESEYQKIDLLATCAAIGPPANVADYDLERLPVSSTSISSARCGAVGPCCPPCSASTGDKSSRFHPTHPTSLSQVRRRIPVRKLGWQRSLRPYMRKSAPMGFTYSPCIRESLRIPNLPERTSQCGEPAEVGVRNSR